MKCRAIYLGRFGSRASREKHARIIHEADRPSRDAQFLNIARLRGECLAAADPVVSIDTKKQEQIGNFYRPGTVYSTGQVEVFDHDLL